MTVQKDLHWNFSRVHRFTNSILSSVHPSFWPLVRTEMLGPNRTDFRELHIKLQCRIYNCHVYAVSSLCLQSLASWDCGFELHREHGCLSFVNVVCCHVEVCVSGWSLAHRSPIEFGFSECDREASNMTRPWPTGVCYPIKQCIKFFQPPLYSAVMS